MITVNFTNNNAFNEKAENITLTLNPPTITNTKLEAITGKTGQPTTITATLTTDENTPVNQGQVTFTTTDYTQTIQVTNGTATTTHTFTQTLNDTLTATYTPENPENYNIQTNTTTITITEKNKELTLKIDTKTFIKDQNNTIKASIYQEDSIQNNITGGKVVFKVNGKSLKDTNGKVIYAKVINGTASIENYTVPSTWNKENITLTAVYSGYKEYKSLRSQEEQITLTTPTPTTTITPITENIQTGSTIKLQAKVTNGNTPITTGKIVFKLNGKTLKDKNGKIIYAQVDTNGTVNFDYNIGNLKVNTYNLTATFISTGYDKLTADTTINVVKA